MKQWQRMMIGAGALAAGVGWIGLQQPAPSLLPPPQRSEERGSTLLPDGMPAPVRAYLGAAAGDSVPAMETAIAWGTGRLRRGPAWLSLRWRSYLVPGSDFYRTLEGTWFGRILFTGYDAYVHNDGVLALGAPLNVFETGPAISQAENMALWAQAPLTPAVLAGADARWEAIDATAARLRVPFAGGEDTLRASFDPASGFLRELTGERHRGPEGRKRSWQIRFSQWRPVAGLATRVQIPQRAVLQWADESQPYGDLIVDGVVYNVDVSEKIPVEGPAAQENNKRKQRG